MENRHIVAIDAGSSKISIAVAYQVENGFKISCYKTAPSAGISRGRIQNVQQASEVIQGLVGEVKEDLGLDVKQAVINLPRFPITKIERTATITRDEENIIQEEEIQLLQDIACNEALKEDAENNQKAKMVVYDCIAQSYSDGMDFQIPQEDITGRYSDYLEGQFHVYLGKSQPAGNVDNCLGLVDLTAARKVFMAPCTGKMVLDNSDVENGVAMVDIGGGTTSVAIYSGGILRHFDSIPFGGRNVTMDIRNECGLSETLAENIKKAYGICCPDKLLSMGDKYLRIKLKSATRDKEVGVKYLSEIVTARMREIFDAVLYIIQESGMADDLRSGIVLTGGGAMLTNCTKLLEEMSGYTVRIGSVKKKFNGMGKELYQPDAAGCLGLLYAAQHMEKTFFVSDPEDPRFNAIDDAEPAPEPVVDLPDEPVVEAVQAPEKPAAPAPAPKEAPRSTLFGKDAGKSAEPAKAPEKPRKPSKMGSFFGMLLDSDEKQGEQGDLFGDKDLF